MTTVEKLADLIKTLPYVERVEMARQLGAKFGLSQDEIRMVVWKADGKTEEEIVQIKSEIANEAKTNALMKYMSEYAQGKNEHSANEGDALARLAQIAKLNQLTTQGKKFQDAFIEIFAVEVFHKITDSIK